MVDDWLESGLDCSNDRPQLGLAVHHPSEAGHCVGETVPELQLPLR
jgi:hypothetical protein